MPIQSLAVLPYKCHEALHPWHKDCASAAWMLAEPCFRESFKIYCVFYGVTAINKLRKVKTRKQLYKLIYGLAKDIIQSTIFLGVHGVLFMPMCCAGRRVFGHLSYYKMYFQILLCTLPAIYVERKQRRGALALYMANLAIEVLFKMATERKLFKPLHNGEVLIFAIASSIYAFVLKTTSEYKHNGLLFSTIKSIIGKDECAPSPTIESSLTTKKQKSIPLKILNKYVEKLRNWSKIQNPNHPICKHKYHCVLYTILGFIKRFAVGVMIQTLLHFSSSPIRFLRHPKLFFTTLSKKSFDLGRFLGFYSGIYRLISCLLRNLLKHDRHEHGLIAGYFAGFAMLSFKSSTIALYMMAKLIESIYFKFAHDGKVPILSWFDSVLYALSTALVFHAAVLEPQAMRPAYYRFLERLTGGHFSEVNRPMLDGYGVKSSKLFPNYKLPSTK